MQRHRTTPGWQFVEHYDPGLDELQLHLRLVDHSGTRWAVEPFVFTNVREAARRIAPSLSTGPGETAADINGFLQAALDAAWERGLRPAGYADHKNELTAVRYHLEDMRKLAKVNL